MALSYEDFIAPDGRVDPRILGDDAEVHITKYIAQAEGRTADVDAQIAWVYHRAFDFAATTLASRPASESVMSASQSYSDKQIDYFRQLAHAYLDEYNSIVEPAGAGRKRGRTRGYPIQIVW